MPSTGAIACPYCGQENDASARFCTNAACGRFLDRGSAAPPIPATPTAASAAPVGAIPVDRPLVTDPVAGPSPPVPPDVGPPNTPSDRAPLRSRPRAARPERSFTFTRPRADPVHVLPVEHAAAADEAPSTTARSTDGRHALFVALDGGVGEVAAGSEWVGRVRIANTGVIVERVDLRVDGIPSEWVSFEPPQVNLDQQQEETVLLRIHPPRRADAAAGRRPYTVHVWSLTDPTAHASLDGLLTVTPFAGARVLIEPTEPSGSRSALVTAVVHNDGNAPLQATIATTAADALRLHPPSTDVVVAAGETAAVTVRVTARQRLWTPPARRHPIRIEVTTAAGALDQHAVTFTQRPLVPSWALKALAVAAALVAVLGGLGVKRWLDARPRPVPNVVNLPVAQAKVALDQAGFADPRVSEQPNAAAAGVVFAQDPAPASSLGGREPVSLSVSTGPAPSAVPNVQGLSLDDAKAKLTTAGFTPVVDKPINDPVPKDHVAKQNPLPDTPSPAGAVVTLTPSLGAETVTVPDLRRKTRSEVDSTLQSLGLTLTVGGAAPPANAEPGTAFVQTPVAGTKVAKGSSVVVSFAREASATTAPPARGGSSSAGTTPVPAPPPPR